LLETNENPVFRVICIALMFAYNSALERIHMADTIRVGIIGAGWPGGAHAKGYEAAGGFKTVAVADLIPARRKALLQQHQGAREYADATSLLADKGIDAVSVCLPNHLHAEIVSKALRAGKHVVCEKPPAVNVKEAKQLEAAATRNGKVLLYAFQRRFGSAEMASRQAIEKGYAGNVYHVRSSWTRTRGIPIGTGWFTDKSKSGGGALIDIGVHMLDLGWHLLGQPKPVSVYGITHQRFADRAQQGMIYDVEDAAFALIRFEGNQSLELATSWALNQPPQQNGTACRAYGDKGAIEVYSPQGATLYRSFDTKGEAKQTPLKGPKVVHHAALMRHFRECVLGKAQAKIGPKEGVAIMQMIEGIYKSSEIGKSVEIK
jgi:predicted dehydrogenase